MCTNKSLTSRFSALWHRMRLLLLIMCDCIVSVTWGQEPGAGRCVPGVGRVLLPLMCSSNPVTSIQLDDRNLGDMHVCLCRAVCLLKSTLTCLLVMTTWQHSKHVQKSRCLLELTCTLYTCIQASYAAHFSSAINNLIATDKPLPETSMAPVPGQ